MDRSVFQDRGYFVVLNDVVAGKVTGAKEDTVTIFYQGGSQVYFHVGDNAQGVISKIGRAISEMQLDGVTRFPPEHPSAKFEKEW